MAEICVSDYVCNYYYLLPVKRKMYSCYEFKPQAEPSTEYPPKITNNNNKNNNKKPKNQ